MIRRYRDHSPTLGRDVFIADSADVIGDVTLGDEASVWFRCVLRGDVGWIRIGKRTNIQDLSVIHVTGGQANAEIGDGVTVGHRVVLHGCRVEDACLIGIGAIVLDEAVIGEGSLVGAGALVTPGKRFPPRSLILGSPAKRIREVDEKEARMGPYGADHYVALAREYAAEANGAAEEMA